MPGALIFARWFLQGGERVRLGESPAGHRDQQIRLSMLYTSARLKPGSAVKVRSRVSTRELIARRRSAEFMHLRRDRLPKRGHAFDLMSLAGESETCDLFSSRPRALEAQNGIANTQEYRGPSQKSVFPHTAAELRTSTELFAGLPLVVSSRLRW